MLHIQCKVGRVVSDLSVKAREWVVELSGEPIETWHGRTDRMLGVVARAAGISFRGARSLFYPQGHTPNGETIEKVRRAVEARRERIADARQKRDEADREDTRELLQRIATLEAWLSEVDPSFRRQASSTGQPSSRSPVSEEG